jgi:hypothetical protein
MARVSKKNDEHAKSIDLEEESDEGERDEEESEILNEMEDSRRAMLDVFASSSKEKDKVVNK